MLYAFLLIFLIFIYHYIRREIFFRINFYVLLVVVILVLLVLVLLLATILNFAPQTKLL